MKNNTTFTPDHLKNSFGSFWTEFFSDQALLDGWSTGLSLQARQLDRNLEEIKKLSGVQTTEVEHTEMWRPIRLIRDLETGSFYPLTFRENGAKFGEEGPPPFYDKEFNFGEDTDHLGLELGEEEIKPNDIMFLTDSIRNPSFVLSSGVDYEIRDGAVVFVDNVVDNGLVEGLKETFLYKNQDVYSLWGYSCTFDLKYMAEQWGYLLGYEQDSSVEYNRSLWELWKARRFGLTPEIFKEIVSIYTHCPRCKGSETIEDVVPMADGSTTVITDKDVYHLEHDNPVRFSIGDSVEEGEFLGSKISVFEPGKSCFTREMVTTLPEYVDNKLLGEEGYLETNYIRFTADEAPSTIDKSDGTDYTPSYAKLSLSSGEFDVTVREVHRHSQYDFTLEIDVAMLPVPGTQVGTLQIFSVTGAPWFVEPYTASINPIKGTATLFTDQEELLIENKDSFQDLVEQVDRVVLISVLEDQESKTIKSILEGLRFSDKRRLSVTEYPSISVYSDLPTDGASFSTISEEQLLNYDMVLLNTGSGVISKVVDGEVQTGPSIADNEFIQTAVASIDKKISEKRKELERIDNDLIWILNYVNKGNKAFSPDWLYQLCGTRGVPLRSTVDGTTFYSYGAFSELDPEKVDYHELNNRKVDKSFAIPEVPWKSSTGLGVVTREINVPVYSKRIDISGTAPRLETSLPSGNSYVYKIASVEKK